MKANELLVEFYNAESDRYGVAHVGDTRRPRLTLKHLNKLKRLKRLKKEEDKSYLELVRQMYKLNTGENNPLG